MDLGRFYHSPWEILSRGDSFKVSAAILYLRRQFCLYLLLLLLLPPLFVLFLQGLHQKTLQRKFNSFAQPCLFWVETPHAVWKTFFYSLFDFNFLVLTTAGTLHNAGILGLSWYLVNIFWCLRYTTSQIDFRIRSLFFICLLSSGSVHLSHYSSCQWCFKDEIHDFITTSLLAWWSAATSRSENTLQVLLHLQQDQGAYRKKQSVPGGLCNFRDWKKLYSFRAVFVRSSSSCKGGALAVSRKGLDLCARCSLSGRLQHKYTDNTLLCSAHVNLQSIKLWQISFRVQVYKHLTAESLKKKKKKNVCVRLLRQAMRRARDTILSFPLLQIKRWEWERTKVRPIAGLQNDRVPLLSRSSRDLLK